MKKFYLGLLSLAMSAMTASAVDQLYLCGADFGGDPSTATVLTPNDEGNFVFTTGQWSKVSTVSATDWDTFNGGCITVPAGTVVKNVQDQTLPLTKRAENMPMPTYGASTYTYTINAALTEVQVHGSTAPVAGDYTKMYVAGDVIQGGTGWSFTAGCQLSTDDGNLYYRENVTIVGGKQFKVAGQNWNPNYGDGGSFGLNTIKTLSPGSNPNNCTYNGATTSGVTVSFNMTTGEFLFSTEGKKVGDSTDKNPYADMWVNLLFQNNGYADNGVHPDSEGIATFEELAIGTGGFKVKTYLTEDQFYSTGAAIAPNTWVTLSEMNQDMTVTGATGGSVYNVKYNVATNQIYMEPTKVTYPETMFIIGNVNGADWNYNNGVEMTAGEDGIFTTEFELGNSGSGYGYFSFTTSLGLTGWGDMGQRYAAVSNDYDVTLGEAMPLSTENADNSFKAEGDKKYSVTVDLTSMQVTVSLVEDEPEPEPVYTYYINGPIIMNGPAEMEMTMEDNLATAKFTAQRQVFNIKAVSGETVVYYGPVGDNNILENGTFQAQVATENSTWVFGGNSFTNGDEITLSFNTTTLELTFEKVETIEPEPDPEPEAVEVTYDFTSLETIQQYAAIPGVDSWDAGTTAGHKSYLISGVALVNDGFTMVTTTTADPVTDSSKMPKLYYTGSAYTYRIFQGTTINVKAPQGGTISKFEIAAYTGTAANMGNIKANPEGTATSASKSYIWTAPEGGVPEVTFSCNGSSVFINTITVTGTKVNTGIESVEVENNAPARYFNLQGVEVTNPAHGIFIEVRGNQVRKIKF